MSGLETAIRNALEKSERANPEIRARIYQSARQALEAGLRKQDVTDPATIAAQRQRLEMTIRSIEGEERQRQQTASALQAALQPAPRPNPAPANVAPAAPPISPRPQQPERLEPEMELRGETRAPSQAEPRFGDEGDLGDIHAGPTDHLGADTEFHAEPAAAAPRNLDFKPERAAVRRKPRKFFSRLLVFCIVVAFLGMGAWWVKTSGLLMTASQRDSSVPNPPARVDSQDYNGEQDSDNSDDTMYSGNGNTGVATIDPQDRFSADWIQILGPTDATKAVSGAEAKAENANENEGPVVRLTSQSPTAPGNISIPVPSSVLQKITNGHATVAMTLQSTSSAPTQITVDCDFGALGDGCGRHRFDVTRQKADALFQLRFDKQIPANATGTLVFNTDVDGKATGVNVYAIRVHPGDETP